MAYVFILTLREKLPTEDDMPQRQKAREPHPEESIFKF